MFAVPHNKLTAGRWLVLCDSSKQLLSCVLCLCKLRVLLTGQGRVRVEVCVNLLLTRAPVPSGFVYKPHSQTFQTT